MPDQAPDTAMSTGAGKVIAGHSHISINITAQVDMIYIEAIPNHDIGIITITTEVAHTTPVLHTGVMTIDPTMTHNKDHTTDHPHTEAHHTTPEIEATHVHVHHTYPHDKIHIGHICTPVDHEANHITRRNARVKVEDPHTDYYSSDDHYSNSAEETGYLN